MRATADTPNYQVMFFLLFGWGLKVKQMGQTVMNNCGRCGNRSIWSITKQYRYFSLFFIPVVRRQTEWLHLCPVCNHGEKIASGQVSQLLRGQSPAAPVALATLVATTPAATTQAARSIEAVWASTEQIRVSKTPKKSKTLADGTRIDFYHLGAVGVRTLQVDTYPDGACTASYHRYEKLHREDGPASIERLADGTNIAACYFNGTLHSDEGPAYVETLPDGTRIEKFYCNGKLHRDGGPAVVEFRADGGYTEEYYRRNRLHRNDGPAVTERNADGSRTEYDYRKGVLSATREFASGEEVPDLWS